MNFLTRFGWSLLLFGTIALVASFFGYAPRKLADLSPTAVRVAAGAFMALGGLAVLCGGDPKIRRRIFIGFGVVAGLAALLAGSAVAYGVVQRRSRSSAPPPPPPSVWTPPGSVSAPSSAGDPSSMTVFYEQRRAWERRFGRERVWSVVVHLSGGNPPENFESSLRALVAANSEGGAVVGRTGGVAHASVAPLENGDALRVALERLFPGSRVQLVAAGRQATVFVVPSGSR